MEAGRCRRVGGIDGGVGGRWKPGLEIGAAAPVDAVLTKGWLRVDIDGSRVSPSLEEVAGRLGIERPELRTRADGRKSRRNEAGSTAC